MLGICISHGGAQETIARHWSNWDKAFHSIIVVSPFDDPVPGSITIGPSCKSGIGQIERMKLAVAIATGAPIAAIFEADTIFFRTPAFPEMDNLIMCSQTFVNTDPQFRASIYGHSPWIATGATWMKVLTNGEDRQGGWPDRWLAAACIVPTVRMHHTGFSCDQEWTPEVLQTALEAKHGGALCVHGFKSKDHSEELLK